ncbi:RING finger protein 141-like [Schistocerca piceifrons]|uniref:RING finger protein 141-like n=1 Tax=Schistocerca piceifrons TaxID=274613 RepID=UPI001F5ED228|nr:RING finger protein 141-like [Schistocerca piceifrons]
MGQSNSTDSVIPQTVENLHDDICRQARLLSEIAALSYDDLQECIEQLNQLCSHCADRDGKQLLFLVKKGTDSTLLWKGTVKILCVKFDPSTKQIEGHRLFSLGDFLKVCRSLQSQLLVAEQSSDCATNQPVTGMEVNISQHNGSTSNTFESSALMSESHSLPTQRLINTSMILEERATLTSGANDCCICLERKPDIVLPCTHSYCVVCIEQWNVNHKTCPICREACESTDDSWVISEVPGAHEINEAICSALMGLPSTSGTPK